MTYREFINLIASWALATVTIGIIGPKISSFMIGWLGLTLANTVGLINLSFASDSPPIAMSEFFSKLSSRLIQRVYILLLLTLKNNWCYKQIQTNISTKYLLKMSIRNYSAVIRWFGDICSIPFLEDFSCFLQKLFLDFFGTKHVVRCDASLSCIDALTPHNTSYGIRHVYSIVKVARTGKKERKLCRRYVYRNWRLAFKVDIFPLKFIQEKVIHLDWSALQTVHVEKWICDYWFHAKM